MPVALERRLDALEGRLHPAPPRRVIFIVGMARAGHVWVPDSFSLPSGVRIVLAEGECPGDFEKRVKAAALEASSAPVVIVVGTGTEVAEPVARR